MNLHLDTRQRAMLQEMGVHVWSPRPAPVTAAPVATDTAASTASSAATRTAAPTPVPTPARTPRPAPSAPTTTSAAPAAPASAVLTWTLQAPQPLYPNAPPATSADSRHTTPRWLLLAEGNAGADPLAGDAGALLGNMLHALRLHQQPQVFICVLAPEAPEASAGASGTADTANSANSANNAAPCAAALAQAIAQVQPAVVLVMGRAAARSALGRSEPLGQLRALSHSTNGVPAVVTYDAAYLLRAPTAKAGAWDDLCRARALTAAPTQS